MFNPYAVRPIGSPKFYEHLKDIQTTQYYNTETKEDLKLHLTGSLPWENHERKSMDGSEELIFAIVVMTFLDYLGSYRQKLIIEEEYGQNDSYWVWNSRCIVLENEFFRRQGEFITFCFDKLLERVCWEGICEIEKCMKRMENLLRWTNTAKKCRAARKGEKF